MAPKGLARALLKSRNAACPAISSSPLLPFLTPCLSRRSMATEADVSVADIQSQMTELFPTSAISEAYNPNTYVLTTVHSFPKMEPKAFEFHPSKHLYLPLRRDILHRAVIYEGDKTRLGTASTKWRDEVHGSSRKIRPQKGTGRARLGDKKSPMLKGGGVAFGPKPRDFSTDLPRKIYDLAWRTALSYRYRRGQLVVLEDNIDLEEPSVGLLKHVFERNGWGQGHGRSMVVTKGRRQNLYTALEAAREEGEAKTYEDVDVKDLLSMGRIVIERRTLRALLQTHRSDLQNKVATAHRT